MAPKEIHYWSCLKYCSQHIPYTVHVQLIIFSKHSLSSKYIYKNVLWYYWCIMDNHCVSKFWWQWINHNDKYLKYKLIYFYSIRHLFQKLSSTNARHVKFLGAFVNVAVGHSHLHCNKKVWKNVLFCIAQSFLYQLLINWTIKIFLYIRFLSWYW